MGDVTEFGFIGLGNVGAKLAGSLLRSGFDLTVRDLNRSVAQPFLDAGAAWGRSPQAMAEKCDAVITCLPSPAANVIPAESLPRTPIRGRNPLSSGRAVVAGALLSTLIASSAPPAVAPSSEPGSAGRSR